MKRLFILITFILIISCKHITIKHQPKEVIEKTDEELIEDFVIDYSGLNIVLVLAGLDAKGFANIGVLQGLEKHNILPSKIIATGMGGLTAAFYCSESNSFSLEWKHFKLTKNIYFNFSIIPGKMIEPKKIMDFIDENISVKNFHQLSIPLSIVTTNIVSGETNVINSGNLASAIYSGIALPGMFSPLKSSRNTLFSGFITEGLPIGIALKEKTDAIIAVDLESYNKPLALKNSNQILINAVKSSGISHLRYFLGNEKVFIVKPDLSDITSMNFSDKKYIMNKGLKEIDKISEDLKIFLTEIKRKK